jgi:hypothetical protein
MVEILFAIYFSLRILSYVTLSFSHILDILENVISFVDFVKNLHYDPILPLLTLL